MSVEEVTEKIISTKKNHLLFDLLLIEGGVIRNNLTITKNLLQENKIEEAISRLEFIENTSFHHFLYNQAYLYDSELQNCIYRIVDTTEKLTLGIGRIFDDMEENEVFNKDFLQQRNVTTQEEYMTKFVTSLIDLVLNDLNTFESLTNSEFQIPLDLLDWEKTQGFYTEKEQSETD